MYHGLLTSHSVVGRTLPSTRVNPGMFTLGVLLLAAALSVSCSAETDVPIELGNVQSAVAGGEIDEAEEWQSVVRLRAPMSGYTQTCTGTLIAPNLVITALHCVAPMRDGDFQCNRDGTVTQTKPGAGEIGSPVSPDVLTIHVGLDAGESDAVARGERLITTKSQNICNNDLALVVLDTALDLPLSRLRLDEPTVVGERVTIVGYGATGVSGDHVTRRFKNDVRVTDVGADSGMDTDGTAPPRTLVVGPSACKGDSGGPAFAKGSDGEPAVAGVDSIIIGACGSSTSFSIFTRLAPFKKLVLDAFDQVGHVAWLEGQLEPGVYPQPVEPDGGTDTSGEATTEEEPPVKAQRLKTGCSVSPPRSAGDYRYLAVLGVAFLLRRRTALTSRRWLGN